jgi:beta-1,2-mannosidase
MVSMILRRCSLFLALSLTLVGGSRADTGNWMLGPFTRPPDAAPIIKPNPAGVFDDPMSHQPIHWEATHTFNPAAVVKDGRVYLFYRAEDDSGKSLGGYTSRIGLAVSDDGIRFVPMPTPVLYPDNDAQKDGEWKGGCEDPRCVETEDGTYVLFYTQYRRLPGIFHVDLGMATSKDLIHWTKTGPVEGRDTSGKRVAPSKSASLVCSVRNGRVIATKINGLYWLYYGEGTIRLMSSPNLHDWTPISGFEMTPRPGRFDSALAECGPPALLTTQGIVLIYNGKNGDSGHGDPQLRPGVYAGGQALFDSKDPTHLLARTDHPFFQPEFPWEITGQYGAGTTFLEGLVLFHERWLLYYGCADSNVGVAIAASKPGEIAP